MAASKMFLFLVLAIVATTLQANGQEAKFDSLSSHLKMLFQQKSVNMLKDDLSKNFSIAAYTLPSAGKYLQSIAEQYACDSAVIKTAEKKGDTIKLTAVFYLGNAKSETTGIYLDKDRKILYVDLFDRLYGMNRYQKSRLLVKLPFETDEHGAVYLTVRLNNKNRPLKLLFDTGADGMALRQNVADSMGINATRQQNTSIVGGSRKIEISENNTIYLDTLSIAHQNIALFKEMGGDMDGIIGNNIARLFITRVDFDRKEISLYNFGDYQYEEKGVSIPVTLPAGVFIIPGTISIMKGKPYSGQFVFDIGASYSLICFRPFVVRNRLLVDGFKAEYSSSTISMGTTTPTFCGKASSFSFAGNSPIQNMLVTLMSGSGDNDNWQPGVDGSIGTRVMSRYNFTINAQKKEVYCTPNKSFAYPSDFVLDNYLFGFDNDGRLRIQSQVRFAEGTAMQPGVVVKSINGIPSTVLASDKKKLIQLLSLPSGTQVKIEPL